MQLFSFCILLLQWDLIWKGNTLRTQQKPSPSSLKQSHCSTDERTQRSPFVNNRILRKHRYFQGKSHSLILLFCLPLSPPIFKPRALSLAHLNVSPFFLTPSIQSKPQSALAWIRELLGIPSVSILCVCLCERTPICRLPDHLLDWVSLNRKTFNFCSYKLHAVCLYLKQLTTTLQIWGQGEWFVYVYQLLLGLFTLFLLFCKCAHLDLLFIVFIFYCVSPCMYSCSVQSVPCHCRPDTSTDPPHSQDTSASHGLQAVHINNDTVPPILWH